MTDKGGVEAALWAQARSGDADAFTALYRLKSDAIFGFCLRRTGSWTTAQDCTSLVFLEAWRLRDSLRNDGSVTAWLFGIANNVVRNVRRTRRRHQALLDRLPTPSVEDDMGDVVDRVDAECRSARVVAALGRLKLEDREIISLAAWSGLSTSEIAEALGLPPGTVKSRLSRARQRLSRLADASGESINFFERPAGVIQQ